MKSIKPNQPLYKRKIFIIIALLIAALIIAGSVYAFNIANQKSSTETPSSVDKDNSNALKNSKKEQTYKSVPSGSDQDKSAVQAQDVDASDGTVETPNITRAEQTGDYIRVSAIYSKPSNGTCTLKLEQSGQQTIQSEAPVVVASSYYACNGFRIPVSQLPAKGSWNVTVIHTLNGKTASSKGVVNVQ